MSDVVIYHNPRCPTSRKTLELLRDKGFEPRAIEYLKTPPSRDELAAMIRDAGIGVRDAVRSREPRYAELSLDLNLDQATDDQLLDAMAENPILIQRPFVVTAKGTRLARPVDAVHDIL
jgi:arsenate reductase